MVIFDIGDLICVILRIHLIFNPIDKPFRQQSFEEAEHTVTESADILRPRTVTGSDMIE